MASLFEMEAKKLDGTVVNLVDYEGKVILLVNSATM